jgi:hypothetical protein
MNGIYWLREKESLTKGALKFQYKRQEKKI